MKLPTGGSAGQELKGKIRLDVTGFIADAKRIAAEARKSAKEVENAYKKTGEYPSKGLRDAVKEHVQATKQRVNAEKQAAREIAAVQRESVRQQREGMSMLRAQRLAEAEDLKRAQKPYRDLSSAVGEARTQLIAFTAAAAATVFVGLQAADSVQLLTIRYRELAGSQAEGARLMRQVEKTAREMNLPIRQTQKDFLGLIPAVKQANGSLEEYSNVALRLATLNSDSRGGVEGAIYAIREALSSGGTDLVSLSERFNIPRKILREYIEDTGDLAKALDILLDQYGATDVAVKANARSLQNLTKQLQDTANRALERTFAGALETAKNLIQGFNAALEETPQWLIDLGATAIIAVGGVTALVLATELLATAHLKGLAALVAYGTYIKTTIIPGLLSAAGAAKAFALSTLGIKLGVGAAAVAGGTAIGIGAVNAVGRATGDERLANFGLADAVETLKQGAFLIITALTAIVEALVRVVGDSVARIQNLGLAAQDLGHRFTILFADLGIGIQQMLGVFGDPQELARLQTVRQDASDQLVDLQAQMQENLVNMQAGITTTFRDIRKGIYDVMFPVAPKLESEFKSIADLFDQFILGVKTKLYTFYGEQGDIFADSVGELISFQQELNSLFEEGDISALENRLRGLEREREAIESILPELEKHAEYSDDAAEKLKESRLRLDEITQALPQFLDALEAVTTRGIGKATEEYLDAIDKAETKRTDDLVKLSQDTGKKLADLDKQEAKKKADIRDREAEAQATYNKAIEKAEEAFRKRMLEIQRNYLKAVTLAASQLDAAGVVAAIQARVEQRDEANKQKSEAQKNAQERLDEQRAEAVRALEDMRLEFAERRQEIEADRQLRFNAIQAEYKEASRIATEALGAELTRIQEYYTRRYNDLIAYQEAERALTLQNQAKYLSELANAVIYPTINEIMSNPVVKSLLALGGTVANSLNGGQGVNLPGIGTVQFNINGAQDPNAVAQAVNAQLVKLSTGGRAGVG